MTHRSGRSRHRAGPIGKAHSTPAKILVDGGIETVRSLFLGGVVDTLTRTVHPVVTGEGRRLFDESVDLTRLRLVDATTTSLGKAVLTDDLRE